MINSFLVKHSGKVGAHESVLLIAILLAFYESAESVLVKTPTNTTVIANQSTFFNCSKSGNKSEQLTWYHYAVDGQAEGVYESGSIRGTYKGRFDIDINITSGTFNLLVQRAETSDAGRYACVEDPLGNDPGASAELIVLNSTLDCEANMDLNEVIGSTQCDKTIPSDEPLLSCSVTYSGNIHVAPQMIWRNDEMVSESMKTECNTSGNRVMCNTMLNANLIKDGYVFVCQMTAAKQYNCSLKVNKTIYTSSDNSMRDITLMDEASCSANTSARLPCSYKWYMGNQTEQMGQTLKTNKSGLYRCEAECTIRNETCAFTAKQVNVLESADQGGNDVSSRRPLIVAILVAISAIILAVVAVALWMKLRKTENPLVCFAMKKDEITPEETATLQNLDRPIAYENLHGDGTVHIGMIESHEKKSQGCSSMHEVGTGHDIEHYFNKAAYIYNGLDGEIHGPLPYQGEERAVEHIKFPRGNMTNEQVVAKGEEIKNKGLKWKEIDHINLISIYDVEVLYKKDFFSASVFIIMDYAAGGSVRNALKKYTGVLPDEVLKDWAIQIATGMEYLHKKSILHMNLNSAQILVMELTGKTDIWHKSIKISQYRLMNATYMSTQTNENAAFAAPDVSEESYAKEDDVWSFGIVIWEMLTKEIPYKEVKAYDKIRVDVCQGAKSLQLPDSCPNALKKILKCCRKRKPSGRPAFSSIVRSLQKWQVLDSPAQKQS